MMSSAGLALRLAHRGRQIESLRVSEPVVCIEQPLRD